MTDKQAISNVSQHVEIRQPGQHAGREAKRGLTEIQVFDCPGLSDMDNKEYFSYPVSVLINQPKAGLLKILLVCRLHLLSFPFSTILMHALLLYFAINMRNQQPDHQGTCGSPQHWEDERGNVRLPRLPAVSSASAA